MGLLRRETPYLIENEYIYKAEKDADSAILGMPALIEAIRIFSGTNRNESGFQQRLKPLKLAIGKLIKDLIDANAQMNSVSKAAVLISRNEEFAAIKDELKEIGKNALEALEMLSKAKKSAVVYEQWIDAYSSGKFGNEIQSVHIKSMIERGSAEVEGINPLEALLIGIRQKIMDMKAKAELMSQPV